MLTDDQNPKMSKKKQKKKHSSALNQTRITRISESTLILCVLGIKITLLAT